MWFSQGWTKYKLIFFASSSLSVFQLEIKKKKLLDYSGGLRHLFSYLEYVSRIIHNADV